MDRQKGFATVLVIAILVIAAIGGAYWLGTNKTSSPSKTENTLSTPKPTEDETANWKTYQSNLGFSFRYPELSWSVSVKTEKKLLTDSLSEWAKSYCNKECGIAWQQETIISGKTSIIQEVTTHPAGRQLFTYIPENDTNIILISMWNKIENDPTKPLSNNVIQQTKTILSTFKFTQQTNTEGSFCGGIAGIECPKGYECIPEGKYPDAGGKCVKE